MQPLIETALIVTGLLAMLFFLPHTDYGDGKIRFEALSAFLEKGQIPSTKYSLVGPLFSTPLWLLGKIVATPREMTVLYNVFIFTIGIICLYLLLKDRMDRSLLRKFLLLLIAASMFGMHITAYYGEVFTAVCVGVGTLAIFSRTTAGVGWVAILLGVVNTPASLVALACMLLKHMLDRKRWRYVLLFAVAITLVLIESWWQRGNAFNTGYDSDSGFRTIMPYSGLPGFSYPFFLGLLSILFSFGKGLIFFTPGLLLPLRRRALKLQQSTKFDFYSVYWLWLCFLGGLILVYAQWWAWYGGLFWGPRFFLLASIPASFALATRLHDQENSLLMNLFTLLVLCLSFWVGLNGSIYGNAVTALPVCMDDQAQMEILCHYTPEFSVLWYPFVSPQPLSLNAVLYTIYWGLTFAYFIIPLLLRIGRQMLEVGKHFQANHLNFKMWRL